MGWVRADIERVVYFGLKVSPLCPPVTASAARLGARLRDGDPLEDMGMFTE